MTAESYWTACLLQQENHQHTEKRQWHPQTFQVTKQTNHHHLLFITIVMQQAHILISSTCCVTCVFRMTLLLGPPSSGKSTLMRALTGKLDKSLKVLTRIVIFPLTLYGCMHKR
jgi:GTP1/Obg family GTP-binding protein